MPPVGFEPTISAGERQGISRLRVNCNRVARLLWNLFTRLVYFLLYCTKLWKDKNMTSNVKWGIVREMMLVKELFKKKKVSGDGALHLDLVHFLRDHPF